MENNTEQIIEKYCGQIEERIDACRDKKVAEYLKQNICLELKRHSNDQFVLNYIETYIDQLIDDRFSDKRNKGIVMRPIKKTIPIEDLITKHPSSVHILMKQGIKCIVCGEPIWGTLEDAAKQKGFSDDVVNRIVEELNDQIEGIE